MINQASLCRLSVAFSQMKQDMGKKMKKRSRKATSTTTNEYGSVSSIHGISYVFSKDIPLTDRLLWVLLVAASLMISGLLSWKAYANWKENPVITSLVEVYQDNEVSSNHDLQ